MENRTGIEGEDEMLAGFCKSPPASSRRWLLQPKPLHVAHRVAEVAGMFLFSLYLNPVQCSTVRSPVRFETLVSKVLRIDDDCHVYIRICLVVINMYCTLASLHGWQLASQNHLRRRVMNNVLYGILILATFVSSADDEAVAKVEQTVIEKPDNCDAEGTRKSKVCIPPR